MKILKLHNNVTDEILIYLGNEYSPDPLDMLERVRYLGLNSSLFGRSHSLIIEDQEKYERTLSDVENVLTKNGYVLYNPFTISVMLKKD